MIKSFRKDPSRFQFRYTFPQVSKRFSKRTIGRFADKPQPVDRVRFFDHAGFLHASADVQLPTGTQAHHQQQPAVQITVHAVGSTSIRPLSTRTVSPYPNIQSRRNSPDESPPAHSRAAVLPCKHQCVQPAMRLDSFPGQVEDRLRLHHDDLLKTVFLHLRADSFQSVFQHNTIPLLDKSIIPLRISPCV